MICKVEGCTSPVRARGWCSRHYQKWQKYGDPLHVEPRPRKSARYKAMHWRLTRDRGPARNYPCVDCGKPASHWSYDGGDTNERTDHYPLSTDPDCYHPRCDSCHVKHDGTGFCNPATVQKSHDTQRKRRKK